MKNCKYFEAKGIDYKGQLQKIPKANIKFQPLYEALTNSIEAIKLLKEENNDEQITISFFFNSHLFGDTDSLELSRIELLDYGIGFNDKEFERFTQLHDNTKGFHNQGSGRVQYMHFFDKTQFESVYRDENSETGFYKRIFWLSKNDTFLINKAIICFDEPVAVQANESFTKITFKNFLDEEDKKYYNSFFSKELKDKLVEHYLYYFCENRNALPKIEIKTFVDENIKESSQITQDDIPTEDKNDNIKINYKKLTSDKKLIILEDKTEIFHIKAFKLNKEILHSNDLKLISKHEIVRGKFDKKIELSILKPNDTINDNRYLFLVSSSYIDERDSDNRGELKLYTDEEFKENTSLFVEDKIISLTDIQSKVNEHILTLYSEILEKKNEHNADVAELQKMFLIDEDNIKSVNINVQDTDEEILKKVYKYNAKRAAENDAKLKEEIKKINRELDEMNPSDNIYRDELSKKVAVLVKKIPLQNKNELAHSVAKRKIVLDLFDKILDKELNVQQNETRNIDEELLHNLIFKQSSTNPEESDLWLVNEDFIYFKGTSEKKLSEITVDGETILKDYESLTQDEKDFRNSLEENRYSKRPDVLLFPDEGKCIILEFKNPEVNISSHLQQIQNYATLIWNFSKDKFQFNTFYGYYIGEKINNLDVRSKYPSFIESYHFDYLFRPSEIVAGFFGKRDANIYTEVIKYSTLLKRAKRRNELFIKKLGIR